MQSIFACRLVLGELLGLMLALPLLRSLCVAEHRLLLVDVVQRFLQQLGVDFDVLLLRGVELLQIG